MVVEIAAAIIVLGLLAPVFHRVAKFFGDRGLDKASKLLADRFTKDVLRDEIRMIKDERSKKTP